jgi:tRNA modification GTPase
MHDLETTIVAVSTPPGRGGVACLRLSGPSADAIARRMFTPRGGVVPSPGGAPVFGRFLDRRGKALDHGYLCLFPEGHSYTGEPTAELWSHGSPAVLSELMDAALTAGAEPAGPGEFTYRAVRHGRIDLTRAEAIRDLIAARTSHQARIAYEQLEGAVARHLLPLRRGLEDQVARAEAAVEFVDEAETALPRVELRRAVEESAGECRRLLDGFRRGRVIREGAGLALVGRPNVGKSSLFNRLLARERAIVTEIAGTTRDTLEEELDVGGAPVRLVDTAGLRSVTDPVEDEGVRRAHAARETADLVLLVLDASGPPSPEERELIDAAGTESPRRTLVVANKSDLPGSPDPALRVVPELLVVSAKTGDGIDRLRERLAERLLGSGVLEDPVVTSARQARALERAGEALDRALAAIDDGLTEELVLEDLKQALSELGTIGGEFSNEALYDRIFSTFCIGK